MLGLALRFVCFLILLLFYPISKLVFCANALLSHTQTRFLPTQLTLDPPTPHPPLDPPLPGGDRRARGRAADAGGARQGRRRAPRRDRVAAADRRAQARERGRGGDFCRQANDQTPNQ